MVKIYSQAVKTLHSISATYQLSFNTHQTSSSSISLIHRLLLLTLLK